MFCQCTTLCFRAGWLHVLMLQIFFFSAIHTSVLEKALQMAEYKEAFLFWERLAEGGILASNTAADGNIRKRHIVSFVRKLYGSRKQNSAQVDK